jgi:hypothetical protein
MAASATTCARMCFSRCALIMGQQPNSDAELAKLLVEALRESDPGRP